MRRPLALIPIALLAGCAKPDRLIGSWSSTMELDDKVGTKVTTFRPDGTYTMDMRFQGPSKALTARDEGTWSRPDAGHLKLLLKDTKWTLEGATSKRQTEIDAKVAKMKQGMVADFVKAPPSVITWVDDDHFILKDGDTSVHLRRKH